MAALVNPPSPTVTVNLSALTGRTVNHEMFGVATGAAADSSFALLANSTFRATSAILNPPLVRINADQNICQTVFAAGIGSPDYSYFDNWFSNYASFAPGTRLVVGIGPTGTDTSISTATWGSWASTLAAHFKTAGTPIVWWEVGNENDAMGAATYATYFLAIANAIHGVDATYQVGGPTTSWYDGFTTGGGGSLNSFATAVGSALNFVCFHSYLTQSGAATFSTALGFTDIASARSALVGTPAANVPIGLLEYNENGTVPGDITQQQIYGAVYISLLLATAINQGCSMAALWDWAEDSLYGAIGGNSGALSSMDPQGYFLSLSNQYTAGPQVTASTSFSNLQCLVVFNGTTFGLALTNYDLSNSRTAAIALNGAAIQADVTAVELSAAHPTGITTSHLTSLASVTVPAESIVFLSGSLVSAPAPVQASTWTIRATVTTVAGSPKTLIQYVASSTNTAEILGFSISQSSTGASLMEQVRLVRKTTPATVAAGVVGTSVVDDNGGIGTFFGPLTTAGTGTAATSEGTDGDELWRAIFSTMAGYDRTLYSPDVRVHVPEGGVVALKLKAVVAQTYDVCLVIREMK